MKKRINKLFKKYDYLSKQVRKDLEIVMRQIEIFTENIAYKKPMEERFNITE